MTEANIRDRIAKNLNVINENLSLIEKEHHLKNCIGSKGYIDILAQDEYNNFVIIEIKRSNVTAREALHEIHKYVGLLKQNYKCKDYEIRVIILSTDWRELLVPFSEVVYSSQLDIEGFEIHLDNNENITVSRVNPESIEFRRQIGIHHKIFYFYDWDSLSEKLKIIIDQLKKLGIIDFVVFFGHKSAEKNPYIIMPYMLYLVIQNYTFKKFLNILYEIENTQKGYRKDDELNFPMFSWVKDLNVQKFEDEEEELYWINMKLSGFRSFTRTNDHDLSGFLQESLLSNLKIDCAEVAASNPQKFEQIFDVQNWNIIDTHRYGLFSDPRYSSQLIEREVRGYDGANPTKYYNFCESHQRKRLKEIVSKSTSPLHNNPKWKSEIETILKEILSYKFSFRLSIKIFNPQPLWLVFEAILRNGVGDTEKYLPQFQILIDNTETDDETIIFHGRLAWKGTQIKVPNDDLINAIKNARIYRMQESDRIVGKEFGLVYETEKTVLKNNSISFKHHFVNNMWTTYSFNDRNKPFIQFWNMELGTITSLNDALNKIVLIHRMGET